LVTTQRCYSRDRGKKIPQQLLVELQRRQEKNKRKVISLFECIELANGYEVPEKSREIEVPSGVPAQFAIVMPDNSMHPDYSEGDILFISEYGGSRYAPYLLLFSDQTGMAQCAVRHVDLFKYDERAKLWAKNDEDLYVDRNSLKCLGKVVWRSKGNRK
jgi:hypothetical protein